MAFNLSGLTPYQPGAPTLAPSTVGLDVSGLTPYNADDVGGTPSTTPTAAPDAAPTAPTSDDAAAAAPSWQDVARQAGYGLLSGIPDAVSSTADMLETGTMGGFTNPNTGENLFHQLGRDLGVIQGPAPDAAPYRPVTGTAIKGALGAAGLNPDALPQPQNGPERVGRAIGSGAALMLAPELSAGKLASVGDVLGAAATGAASGAAGQLATDAAPDNLKPLASVAGTLAGGMGAEAAGSAFANTAERAGNLVAPFTAAGQQEVAALRLASAASDPAAAVASIDSAPREIVPGSSPTTGQLTGDMGLLSLERATATQNPEMFNQLRADQNAARLDTLNNLQADGNPAAAADFFRGQLSDIDQRTQAAYDDAQQQAQTAASNLGAQAPDVVGNQLRSALETQLAASKAQEASLWKAVDPDNSLNVVTSPLKSSVQTIYGDMGPAARLGVTPAESGIASVIGQYGPTIPFNELTAVRSQISQAMRDAKSPLQPNDVAYGRLSQLRGAVEDAISDSVQGKVAQEQQAVAAGTLAPENTLSSGIQKWAEDWRAQNELADANSASGTSFGSGSGATSPVSLSGAAGQGSVGPSVAAGNQGLPQDAGSGPLVDQAAADRLAAATAATAARKQTFGAKPVSAIMQRPGASYPYTLAPENIAAQVWRPGPPGAVSIDAVLKAAKNAPEAIDAVRTGAAASLRKAAGADDGSIDPGKFATWKKAHGEALDALEKASPNSTVPYEDAAKAGTNLRLIAAQRRAAIDAFQKSEAGKLLGVTDPADVTRVVGGIFGRKDSVSAMRALASRAAGDPAAADGLRKAVVDFMMGKLVSNTEAAASGKTLLKADQFQTFLNRNHPALREVFAPDEMKSLQAIAADLQRANRSITAVKLPGGSNTAQDTAAMERYAHQPSILTRLIEASMGGATGAMLGHGIEGGVTGAVVGATAGQLARWLGNMRAAGIANVGSLVRDAMLDPDLAKTLLMKASAKAGKGSDRTFGRVLTRIALQSAALQGAEPKSH